MEGLTGFGLSPMSNWAFLKIFGEDGSKRVSGGLANAVLAAVGAEPIDEVDAISADSAQPNGVTLKSPRTDVRLVCGERVVDLEAQLRRVDVGNKALYYASMLLGGRVPKGRDDSYGDLPQTIVIMLVQGYRAFPESGQYVTPGCLRWEVDGGYERANDRITIVICELDKVVERYHEEGEPFLRDELAAWLYALAEGYRYKERMCEAMARIPSMAEFFERYDLTLRDPGALDAYRSHMLDILEENSVRSYAMKEGREQGIAQGIEQGIEQGIAQGREQGIAQGREQGIAQGREQGIAQGREQGIEEGRERALVESARNLMESLSLSAEQAMDAMGVPARDREGLVAALHLR